MYILILILNTVPLGIAITAAAHASLALYLEYSDTPHMQDWVKHSFKKVVRKVSGSEFLAARTFEGCTVVTESALGGVRTALVFTPRPDDQWPKPFKFYRLYK